MTLLNESTIIFTGATDATCYTCNLNDATNQWLCSVAPYPEVAIIVGIAFCFLYAAAFVLGFIFGDSRS